MYRINSVEELTPQYLSKVIDEFLKSKKRKHHERNLMYYLGDNPSILERDIPDDSGPDNRIPIAYGRRIVNLVDGYMYKPGLINYAFPEGDETFEIAMRDVFDANKEPVKSEQMGKQVSTQGLGYEYHYVAGDSQATMPRFAKFPVTEVVTFYNKDIEPKLLAFVRVVEDIREEKGILEVLYGDDKVIREYTRSVDSGSELQMVDEAPHFYGMTPLVDFANNEEKQGDFDSVQPLIDAYDVLISDSMNEFDRFAWAYLLLKGMALSQENAEKVKRLRMFENLDETGDVSFLTKDIATEFISFMADLLRGEIHRQSGIPNLEDYDGAGASGKTLTKFIYLMELFTDPKESYFKDGLYKRMELINQILTIQGTGGDVQGVEIIMNRNTPDNSLEQGEMFNAYAGQVSLETRLENFADFVDDPVEEIAKVKAEGSMIVSEDVDAVGTMGDVVEGLPEEVAKQALNGAQIKSMVEIVQGVSAGTISRETAIELLKAAFPMLSEAEILAIINPATSVKVVANAGTT